MMKINNNYIIELIKNLKDPTTSLPLGQSKNISNIKIVLKNIKITIETSPDVPNLTLNCFKQDIIEKLQNNKDLCEHKIEIIFSNEKFKKETKSFKNVFAIYSAKGGVGKSTITFTIAKYLSELGVKVGIIDADIHGPSINEFFNTTTQKINTKNNKIIPLEKDNIKYISMGNILEEKAPSMFRGPILLGSIKQFINEVEWSDIDVLLVDTPPGTGDVLMTIASELHIDGVINITTPNNLSTADVSRGVNAFNKLGIKNIGLIINMAYFVCNNCTEKHFIFNNLTDKEIENITGQNIIAKLPLMQEININNDFYNNKILKSNYKKIIQKIIQKIKK